MKALEKIIAYRSRSNMAIVLLKRRKGCLLLHRSRGPTTDWNGGMREMISGSAKPGFCPFQDAITAMC